MGPGITGFLGRLITGVKRVFQRKKAELHSSAIFGGGGGEVGLILYQLFTGIWAYKWGESLKSEVYGN